MLESEDGQRRLPRHRFSSSSPGRRTTPSRRGAPVAGRTLLFATADRPPSTPSTTRRSSSAGHRQPPGAARRLLGRPLRGRPRPRRQLVGIEQPRRRQPSRQRPGLALAGCSRAPGDGIGSRHQRSAACRRGRPSRTTPSGPTRTGTTGSGADRRSTASSRRPDEASRRGYHRSRPATPRRAHGTSGAPGWRPRPTTTSAAAYADAALDDGPWTPIEVPGHWRTHRRPSPSRTARSCTGAGSRHERHRPRGHAATWLTLDGLFYQGDVWLDGAYLGDTEGYLRPPHLRGHRPADRPGRAPPRHRGDLRARSGTRRPSATSPASSSTGTASTTRGTPAASGARCASRRPARSASATSACSAARRAPSGPAVVLRANLETAEPRSVVVRSSVGAGRPRAGAAPRRRREPRRVDRHDPAARPAGGRGRWATSRCTTSSSRCP